MNLSDLQTKEVIDISTGRRIGSIIDVLVDKKGSIIKLILEEKRPSRKLFSNGKDEISIRWNQIVKIGDDIMLVDNKDNDLTKWLLKIFPCKEYLFII